MKIQEINNGYSSNESNKKTYKRKKIKRKLAWLKFILLTVLIVTCLVLLALSPAFNIRTIVVQGSNHYSIEEIINSSGIVTGSNGFKTIGSSIKNIFTLRDGNAEKSILKNCPYIKEVKANFILSGKIRITLIERKPFGVIHYLGTNLIIDDQGYVLDTVRDSLKSKLPIIRGINFKNYNIGQALLMTDKQNLFDAVTLIEAIRMDDIDNTKVNLMKKLDYIDVSDTEKVTIGTDSQVIVNFGDLQDLKYRLDFLKEIILNSDEKGYVDFTSGRNPYLETNK